MCILPQGKKAHAPQLNSDKQMHKEMWLYVGETAAWQKHIFEIQIQVHFNEQIRRSCSVETVTNWNTIHTCAITNTNTKTY